MPTFSLFITLLSCWTKKKKILIKWVMIIESIISSWLQKLIFSVIQISKKNKIFQYKPLIAILSSALLTVFVKLNFIRTPKVFTFDFSFTFSARWYHFYSLSLWISFDFSLSSGQVGRSTYFFSLYLVFNCFFNEIMPAYFVLNLSKDSLFVVFYVRLLSAFSSLSFLLF